MNGIIKIILLIISGFLIVVLAPAGTCAFSYFQADMRSTPGTEGSGLDQSKEMIQFFKAKESLYKQDWKNAKAGLEQYLRDYPAGRLADEALYWMAQCLNRLSKAEKDASRMIALREDAVKRLNDLIERVNTSRWVNDALELRTEISRDLDYFGFAEYRVYLNAAEEEKRQSDRHMRVLRSLRELDKEAALPILKKICMTDNSSLDKRVAIFLLGQYYKDPAIPFLEMIGIIDPDDAVRKEALSVVHRIQNSLIPVQLFSYKFAARLVGSPERVQIRENEINIFELPYMALGENGEEKAVRTFFGNNIGPLKYLKYPSGNLEYIGAYSESSSIFGDADYAFNIVNPDLIKETSRISGMIRIEDVADHKTRKLYQHPFMVDSQHDDLIVMRRGENIEMMLLHFDVTAESQARPSQEEISKSLNSPITKVTHTNLLGCVVKSSAAVQTIRNRMAGSLTSDFMDLGPARAEIPGLGGTWILHGQLLCDKKARLFIGRQFTLTDPQGKVVAKGALVEVPAGSPQTYRIK